MGETGVLPGTPWTGKATIIARHGPITGYPYRSALIRDPCPFLEFAAL